MDRFQDLRFSLRALAKSPGFSLVAVACLAIGVGATTAIFSLANGLFLRPLPGLAEPGRLVDVAGLGSYADFRDLRDSASAAGSLSGVAAFLDRQVSVELPGAAGAGAEAQAVIGQLVTGEYFEVLGTGPQRGRLLGRADEDEGAPVAVIGDRLWRDRFGADPRVVGRTLRLNGVPFTVVGVAPARRRSSRSPGSTREPAGRPSAWSPSCSPSPSWSCSPPASTSRTCSSPGRAPGSGSSASGSPWARTAGGWRAWS